MNQEKELWKFSRITAIEESIFNNTLERFYNLGINGLVRENIQNSIDAKIKGVNEPVVVYIKSGKIKTKNIPGIDDVKERIMALEGHNRYTKETIGHMQVKLREEEVNYISFEDCNTKGLTGAKNGQSNCKEDTWGIYAYNKGVHSEDSDKETEEARGGSHGIGKIASNAASDIHMMYFANCDEDGNKHLGGTIQLIEHKFKEAYYRATGYFTALDNDKFYPYENNFDDVFAKKTRGLKIIVPFLREQFNNEKEIIKSVCSSFFIAILEERLIVHVNDKVIDKKHIENYINNEEYYVQDKGEIKEDFTPLYLESYKKVKPMKIKVSSIEKEYEFDLYFNYDKEISKGRVGIIRTVGMKIEDKKVKGNVNKPFNAVMIPSSRVEDMFLKSLENESHTAISSEHIKDTKLQKNAKRFINNIDKAIAKILEEETRKNNPTDGLIDTKDMIYVVESQFKREISKNVSTVQINIGNDSKKEIVKISQEGNMFNLSDNENGEDTKENDPTGEVLGGNDSISATTGDDNDGGKQNDKKNTSDINGGDDGKEKSKEKRKKRQPRKLKKEYKDDDEINDDNEDKDRYTTTPDIVERIVFLNKEIIKIDFSHSEELRKKKKCDIVFAIIDGMGTEYSNEFNVKENYKKVIDRSTGKECFLSEDKIKNIKINKGIVSIELQLDKSFNKALKFVYYVEV